MGQRLDNLDLPPAGVRYWTAQRKAAVILAIRHTVISIWDACERYDLSAEELAEWERHFAPDTQPGLIYKALINENTARGDVAQKPDLHERNRTTESVNGRRVNSKQELLDDHQDNADAVASHASSEADPRR